MTPHQKGLAFRARIALEHATPDDYILHHYPDIPAMRSDWRASREALHELELMGLTRDEIAGKPPPEQDRPGGWGWMRGSTKKG